MLIILHSKPDHSNVQHRSILVLNRDSIINLYAQNINQPNEQYHTIPIHNKVVMLPKTRKAKTSVLN